MAYKFYVNGKLFQVIKNNVIYKGTVTLPNGKTYTYDNSKDSVDLSAVIRAYIDQKIAATTSYTPAWNGENPKNRWNYIDGVFMNAIVNLYKYTDDESYKTFFLNYIDYYIDADGVFQQANNTSVKATGTSNNGAYYSQELDTVCESKILFDAYQFTQDSRYLTALEFTYNTLMNTNNIPIAANNVSFSHKKTYQYQVWLDGMYMYAPFWCRYAVLHKNPTVTVGNHTDTMFNILYDQFMYIKNNMKDPTTGMYYHAHDTRVPAGTGEKCFWANSSTGNSANIWGRACGWLFAALCDVLDYYPEGTKRNDLISMLSDLADAYVNHLTKNGVLRQLPTLDASVTYNGSTYTNYEEESATAQCAYGILKGARNGYLANVTLSKGIQIFKSLFNTFVLDASTNGPVTETTTTIKVGPLCISAGMAETSATSGSRDGSVKYYLYNSDPTIAKADQNSGYAQIGYDDAKGSGPLIMAYLQYIVANDAVYNVTFTDTEQNSILTHKVKVNSGDIVMAPIILNENKPSGKTLEGWTTGSGTFDFNTPITSDITLSPVWITAVAKKYTITYSTTYGSVASKTVETGYTLTSSDLPTLTQDGYIFGGWYIDSGYTTSATTSTTVTSDIILYAKWTEKPTGGTYENFYINANNLTVGTLSERTAINNGYLVASSTKTLKIESTTITLDGQSVTKLINMGGSGSSSGRTIEFTVEAPCTVTAWFYGTSGRYMRILDSSFKIVGTGTVSGGSETSPVSDSISISSAGTYHLCSSNSGIRIVLVKVEY